MRRPSLVNARHPSVRRSHGVSSHSRPGQPGARREEVAATRAAYGPRHPEHQRAVLEFVKLLAALGKPDAAEGTLREALGMLSATAGPRHVDTLRLAAQLALLLREMGRDAAAEPIYRRAGGLEPRSSARASALIASLAHGRLVGG